VSVKFRTIDTDKFRRAADRYPAGPAHAGAVNHYRGEGNYRLDAIRFRRSGTKPHDAGRSKTYYPVDLIILQIIIQLSDKIASLVTIVSGDNKLMTGMAQAVCL